MAQRKKAVRKRKVAPKKKQVARKKPAAKRNPKSRHETLHYVVKERGGKYTYFTGNDFHSSKLKAACWHELNMAKEIAAEVANRIGSAVGVLSTEKKC